MNKMIAYCGLACHECGAYIATITNDNEKRQEVAQLWVKEYKSDFKPEDIDCLGCLSKSDRVFAYSKECEIRKCGMKKNIDNCAYCDSYVCERLVKFFDAVPDAKKRLDEIRSGL